MPRRRTKRTATKKPPLAFVESPLNALGDYPTPVHCSINPVTANTVSARQLATIWISPHFNGSVPRGGSVRQRYQHRFESCRPRAPSLESTFSRTDVERSTRAQQKKRSLFRPLKFLLNPRLEENSLNSDVETSNCDQLVTPRNNPSENKIEQSGHNRTEGEATDSATETSFSNMMAMGKPLQVLTPMEKDSTENTTVSPVRPDCRFLVHNTPKSVAKDNNGKCRLSRCLFQEVTNTKRDDTVQNHVELPPSTEKIPDVSILRQTSFDSRDSTFNGSLPRVNLRNTSMTSEQDVSLLSDLTVDNPNEDIKKTACMKLSQARTLSRITLDLAAHLSNNTPLKRLPCQVLTSVTLETPPLRDKQLAVLATETPLSYHGLTYRQKQMKGFL